MFNEDKTMPESDRISIESLQKEVDELKAKLNRFIERHDNEETLYKASLLNYISGYLK